MDRRIALAGTGLRARDRRHARRGGDRRLLLQRELRHRDGTARDAVLGVLDVNGWHNLVHIASGVIGLLVAGSYGGSRAYALGLGALYLVVALLGFLAGDGDEIFNLIPVNTEDNFLHLLIGIAGVGGGLATPGTAPPSTQRPAAA